MLKKLGLAGLVIGGLIFVIFRYYYNPFEPRAVVTITPRLHGFILGSVDNNGGQTYGLAPCAKDVVEVKQMLNQLISFNECRKSKPICDPGAVIEWQTTDQIDRNFQITDTGDYFKITKTGSDLDFYLQTSNNPDYMDRVPETFYVCNSRYIEYLNTAFNQGMQIPNGYYPYPINSVALETDNRALKPDYLKSPGLGVAKVTDTRQVNESFVTDFMNLLYEQGYFDLGGFIYKGKIIKRTVSNTNKVITVSDEVLYKAWNDQPPFGYSTWKKDYSITYHPDSRIITSTGGFYVK